MYKPETTVYEHRAYTLSQGLLMGLINGGEWGGGGQTSEGSKTGIIKSLREVVAVLIKIRFAFKLQNVLINCILFNTFGGGLYLGRGWLNRICFFVYESMGLTG